MGEFIDGRNSFGRKEKRRYQAVRAVLSGLTKQVVQEPPDYLSDHYRPQDGLVRALDQGIDNGEIDYDQALDMYVEGTFPPVEVNSVVVDPNQLTLYQRWFANPRIDEPVSGKPLPDVTMVRDPRFDVDL